MIAQRQIKPASRASVNDKASIRILARELEGIGKTMRAVRM
jgi:hypothetical protein